MTTRMLRLRLLNPNTNGATTAMMAAVANETADTSACFFGQTMTSGPLIITDEVALRAAAPQVVNAGIAAEQDDFDGILIAGFGDPGLEELKHRVCIPVTGIAEAGMAEAGAAGRRFSIVTTTPHLRMAITAAARRYGHEAKLASVRVTSGEAETIMNDVDALPSALLGLCEDAINKDGAEAIVIGGGPLAAAARKIAGDVRVPIIEPVAAGARLALERARKHCSTERAQMISQES